MKKTGHLFAVTIIGSVVSIALFTSQNISCFGLLSVILFLVAAVAYVAASEQEYRGIANDV